MGVGRAHRVVWGEVMRTRFLRIVLCLALVAGTLPLSTPGFAAEARIDLDGNPVNGAESTVETKVLQSFPVMIENIIFNNTRGREFTFFWPGAGPGGFESILTSGPDVGTKWQWTTVSQVFTVQSPATFVQERTVQSFGGMQDGVQASGGAEREFMVPGKSIFPTMVTLSSASLTSSLVTFFSPEQTIATCESDFTPGRFEQRITNNTGGDVEFTVVQPGCCSEAEMTICEDGCQSYLTDDNNCGGCGIECAFDEFCDVGACEPICPGAGQELCGETCEDTLNDPTNCGGCGIECAYDEFCDGGSCAPICPGEGQELCNDVCVDTFTDVGNCGACGNQCQYDEFCDGGSCAPICPGDGQEFCDDTCVDTYNDTANCGGCGLQCAFDEYCDVGTCTPICPPESPTLCGETCVDLQNDPLNCGSCGNTCGANAVCSGGECETCRPPLQTNCDNVCVNIHKDPFNCGECGFVCDFSNCPSTGTGACSQGSSCVCDTARAPDAEPIVFEPYPTSPVPVVRPRPSLPRTAATVRPTVEREGRQIVVHEPSTAEERLSVGRPKRSSLAERRRSVRESTREVTSTSHGVSGVIEAPVCGVAPITQVVGDGETFTQCQSGSNIGIEVFTTATVMQGGEVVGQGPCAIIVPAPPELMDDFVPSPTTIIVLDESGDGLLQPGEQADVLVEVVNVGPMALTNVVATLTSPPDTFNTQPITLVSATAAFPDFPALTEPGDCDTPPVLSPTMNTVPFRLVMPLEQEPDVGRVFRVGFQGLTDVPFETEMPFVIGVGEKCDPDVDLDGETYDGLKGFLSPVNADLVPKGNPVNISASSVNQGSNVPLKLKLACGNLTLNADDLETFPEIVDLTHETLGSMPLININADNNSNPNDPQFVCGSNRCEFGLRTESLAPGDWTISVEMPDTRVFEAGITVVP